MDFGLAPILVQSVSGWAGVRDTPLGIRFRRWNSTGATPRDSIVERD